MSRQTGEIVQEVVDAFNSGDVNRVFAVVHPDFEAHVAPEISAEPDTYRGQDGVRRYFDSFREAFDEIRFEVEQFADARDAVVVALRMTARAKHTAISVEQRNAGIWALSDGKVVSIQTFASFAEALACAGLES